MRVRRRRAGHTARRVRRGALLAAAALAVPLVLAGTPVAPAGSPMALAASPVALPASGAQDGSGSEGSGDGGPGGPGDPQGGPGSDGSGSGSNGNGSGSGSGGSGSGGSGSGGSGGAIRPPAGEIVDPPPIYEGPNAILVPYLLEKSLKPPEGWQIGDCAPVEAATQLVRACGPGEILLQADDYDPEFGRLTLPVEMTNGATTKTVDYVVVLEPPKAPEVGLTQYRYPAPAGGTMLMPLTDLDITCTACGEGIAVEVSSVSPAGAATVTATSTHLSIRPHPRYSGLLEIGLRIADSFGHPSEQTTVNVPVYLPGEGAPVALNIFRPMPEGQPVTLDLNELLPGAGEDAALVGCGKAAFGTVVCRDDGSAVYTPLSGAPVDQFSFHFGDGGDQTTGSVTFATGGLDGVPTEGIAAAAPLGGGVVTGGRSAPAVASPFTPPAPPQAAPGTGGLFTPLVGVLDRVGAG